MEKLKVDFRKTQSGAMIAIFPDKVTAHNEIMAYSAAGLLNVPPDYYTMERAKKSEYNELLQEIERMFPDSVLMIA